MCHLSMKLSDMFDQNPACTFDKIRKKPILIKRCSHGLTLRGKGQGYRKNQKPMPWGTKNMPPKKNLSRGSLSNWCDADADMEAVADADINKTIC